MVKLQGVMSFIGEKVSLSTVSIHDNLNAILSDILCFIIYNIAFYALYCPKCGAVNSSDASNFVELLIPLCKGSETVTKCSGWLKAEVTL